MPFLPNRVLFEPEYEQLFQLLAQAIRDIPDVGLELITHRFTARAKHQIQSVFPSTGLPMNEADRQFKYGQFGYGKYVYPADQLSTVRSFFTERPARYLPLAQVQYLV